MLYSYVYSLTYEHTCMKLMVSYRSDTEENRRSNDGFDWSRPMPFKHHHNVNKI